MADVIKMNYPAMQDMAKHCKMVAERLQETVKLAQSTASRMEGGVLVGETGNAFSAGLREGLVPAINRLSQKFEELAADLTAAMGDMKEHDNDAGGKF